MPFGFRTRANDSSDAAAVGAQLGFQFSPTDPGNLLALPFRLFEQGGAGQTVRDVVSGQHAGQPAQLFMLEQPHPDHGSHHESSLVPSGTGPRTFTCAVIGIPADFPVLTISRHAGSIVVAPDNDEYQFESDAFNHAFRVHCTDERCAFSLIDFELSAAPQLKLGQLRGGAVRRRNTDGPNQRKGPNMSQIDPTNPQDQNLGVSRREALKKGAIMGGAAAFAIPVVATMSMSQASAQTTSGGGNPNGNGNPTGGPSLG